LPLDVVVLSAPDADQEIAAVLAFFLLLLSGYGKHKLLELFFLDISLMYAIAHVTYLKQLKHQTFTPVFRFTPFFRIYRGKFTVVKSTLARRKFTTVRYKKWHKFWCIAKKWSKKT
jgi:hypothetical protein